MAELLAEARMTQAELAERMGRPKKTVNEIVKGKAMLTPDTALQLERVLGTPASFWNNREKAYREYLARAAEHTSLAKHLEWLRTFPVSAMTKRGCMGASSDKVEQLRALLDFFGVASPVRLASLVRGPASVAYRKSRAFAANPPAVAAWLRMGEIEARSVRCGDFSRDRFIGALRKVRAATAGDAATARTVLQAECAAAGVAVVVVRELPKTRVSGATRWLSPEKALVQLSLRHGFDDHLWFTFFHEAGHVLLHGKRATFIDDGRSESDGLEAEADEFAQDFLIPSQAYSALCVAGDFSRSAVSSFAQEQGIAPGIVVGRLQHDRLVGFALLNDLKRSLAKEWV